MRLHLQTTVHAWHVVEINTRVLSPRKPLFPQIELILRREKDFPSEERKASGFHVTLMPEEEAKLRKLLEPMYGNLNDEDFRNRVTRIFESTHSGFRVYHFLGSEGLAQGTQKPLFSFGME